MEHSLDLEELTKDPLYLALIAHMEKAFNSISCARESAEVMAIFGLVAAGMGHYYANHSTLSAEEQLEKIHEVSKACLDHVIVVGYRIH